MENFQLYKLGLEKAEELEIKVSTFLGFYRKEFQKNFCFIDYTKTLDCVDHKKLNTGPPYLSPKNPVYWSRSNS